MSLPPDNVHKRIMCLGRPLQPTSVRCVPFVLSSRQILLPQYLVNSVSDIDQTYRKYSLAHTDDLIRFWMSKVKVTAGHRGGDGFHHSMLTLGRRSLSSSSMLHYIWFAVLRVRSCHWLRYKGKDKGRILL